MAEEQIDEFDPGEFPSIEVIYEFVLPSYDWAVRRLDTIERRFDHLLTLTFTLTLAVPVVTIAIAGAESQPNLLHWQGVVALVLFVATAMSGIVIRQHGELTFMNIDGMYDELGDLSPCTFKQHVAYYAGEDFARNMVFLKNKARGSDLVALLFFGEIAFGLWWAYNVISSV